LDIASVLISLVVHDLDHPGRTNLFLRNSKHDLTFLYMDKSTLEHHHVATAFKETSRFPESNIFQNLEEYVTMFHGVGCLIYMCGYQNRSSYHTLRTSIMEMVLATDMSKHFDYLSKFKCMITREVCKHL